MGEKGQTVSRGWGNGNIIYEVDSVIGIRTNKVQTYNQMRKWTNKCSQKLKAFIFISTV